MTEFTRDRAWALVQNYVPEDSPLRKHCLAVEAVMRHHARAANQDEEEWGLVGLLHDFDYDRYPQDHPLQGMRILREQGLPEPLVLACGSHGHLGIPRDDRLRQTLYAVDEMSGFVVAVALVRPGRSLTDVDGKSVRKKMKDKAFARAVNRDDLLDGAALLGVGFDEHVGNVVEGLRPVASLFGLDQ